MGVGFCGEHILPGNDPHSYCFASAYSSDGTCLLGTKPPYGSDYYRPKYSSGDVVGCGIDWKSESYFFTLNGKVQCKYHLFPGKEPKLNSTVSDPT